MTAYRVLLAGSVAVWLSSCGQATQTQAGQPQVQPADGDTTVYAKTPPALRPYSRFENPYYRFFLKELEYPGYGRHIPEPEHVETVKIGFIGPIVGSTSESIGGPGDITLRVNERQTRWDGYAISYLAPLGIKMLQGAQLALRQANATGGYQGRIPYELVVRNDNGNWRASGRALIMLAWQDSVWAVLGTVDGANTHIAIRTALKAEIPVLNTADTDPTLVETNIPWVFRNITDDRAMGYLLADFAFQRLGLQRVAALRAVNRYGRVNIDEFRDAATRLGHPLVVELSYQEGDTLFTAQLERIRSLGVDGVITYGNARESALILRQMRSMGMNQWFFGSDRMVTDEFVRVVGPDHGRVAAGYPYDPTSENPKYVQFVEDFTNAYGAPPETYAAHAYDGMMMLIQAIERAGLNRALIRDELAATKTYAGVTGMQEYDAVFSDRSPATLAVLGSNGWQFYTQAELPTAGSPGVLDTPVEFQGPRGTTLSPASLTDIRIGFFGPDSGEAFNGANLAVEQLNAAGGFRGTPFRLVGRWSESPWIGGAREMVRLVYDDSVWAVLGAVDGIAAHLAEQVVTKAWTPLVVPVSGDPTLTYVRIPWIFRLPPNDETQVDVLIRDGILARSFANVGLITSSDHDGRTFANALQERMRADGVSLAFHFEIPPHTDVAALAQHVQTFMPDAVIVRVPQADMFLLLDQLSLARVHAPLLVPWIPGIAPSEMAAHYTEDVLAVLPFRETGSSTFAAFGRAYQTRYGTDPTPVAAYTYDAVNLLVRSLETSGLNRRALRDAIAAQQGFAGAAGAVAWDNAGGNHAEPVLVVLSGVGDDLDD